MGAGKPDLRIFNYALNYKGVTAPQSLVTVGGSQFRLAIMYDAAAHRKVTKGG